MTFSDLTDGVVHQGIALTIAPYEYLDLDDVLGLGTDTQPALLVVLDGVTDTRNLGAIARSAAAFGATGLVIPAPICNCHRRRLAHVRRSVRACSGGDGGQPDGSNQAGAGRWVYDGGPCR